MKPSHLAALVMAGLGVGGMSAASITAPVSYGQMQAQQAPSAAKIMIERRNQKAIDFALMMEPGRHHGPPPGSYRRKNQRQIRLARRRSNAAGNKKAFC